MPHLCARAFEQTLRKGALYVRTRRIPETAEVPTQTEMRELLELATEKRLRAYVESAERAGIVLSTGREESPEEEVSDERFRGQIPDEEVRWLYSLPTRAELDGVLYVHGSPLADDESFAAEPQQGEERLLTGIRDRTIVFGHSHLQFRRPGPDGTELVNPGSVGMPLDGDRRPAWATWDGNFTFRRTEYDVEPAAAAYRAMGGDFGEFAARRIEKGSD